MHDNSAATQDTLQYSSIRACKQPNTTNTKMHCAAYTEQNPAQLTQEYGTAQQQQVYNNK